MTTSPPATGPAAPPGDAGLYTRKSSGLVREISPISNIILNASFVSIPLAVLVATVAPSAFPGASPFWTTVICAAVCVLPIMLYSLFMAVMPRSGGDYVFVSRTLHPWVGLAANVSIVTWYVLVIAYFAFQVSTFGIAPALTTIGVTSDNDTLVRWGADLATDKALQFVIGAVSLVLCAGMMSVGLRRTLAIQRWLFFLSLLSVLLAFVLLVIHGRGDFVQSVARYGGDYDGILQGARDAGFAGSGSFDLGNTLLALPLAFASFGYAVVTSYAGGEIRSPRTSGSRAMLWALGLAATATAVLMALATRTFGNDFLGSATFLSNAGSDAYPFSVPSGFFFYVSMLTTSTPLIAVLNVSFVLALFVALPVTFLIATRAIFAWSFDRILPQRLSAVDPRTRSPLVATAAVLAVALTFLVFIVWGGAGFLSILYTAGMAELLTFMVVALAGIVFPYRRRAMFAASTIDRRILGIPTITIAGALSLVVYIAFFVTLATQDGLGANVPAGIRATIIIAAIAIVAYPISYLVNRRRGVDLGLAFRELPPE